MQRDALLIWRPSSLAMGEVLTLNGDSYRTQLYLVPDRSPGQGKFEILYLDD